MVQSIECLLEYKLCDTIAYFVNIVRQKIIIKHLTLNVDPICLGEIAVKDYTLQLRSNCKKTVIHERYMVH